MEGLYSVKRGGGGVSNSQKRFQYSPDIASKSRICESSHFGFLFGLFPLEDVGKIMSSRKAGR